MSGHFLANKMLLGFFHKQPLPLPWVYKKVCSICDGQWGQPSTRQGCNIPWITGKFGGFNGAKEPNKMICGAAYWQSANNHSKCEHTNFDSLCSFEDEKLHHSKVQKPTLTEHKNLLTSLVGSVSGGGKLLTQTLLMFVDAIIGLHLGTNWLGHCIPGRYHHLDQLKKQYGFQYAPQVSQLIRCIAVKTLNILHLKAAALKKLFAICSRPMILSTWILFLRARICSMWPITMMVTFLSTKLMGNL